jgi:diadenosine tetraphosphate (Ap4A) HIT family hydrolase
MKLHVEMAHGKHRFAALLNGSGQTVYDRPLLENKDWIVAPTLGAIIPGWLLIIPRQEATNFREWTMKRERAPLEAVRDVAAHLGVSMNEIIWFEHGPTTKGTLVGCGVDYAHLHILIRPKFSFADFTAKACITADLRWSDAKASSAYTQVGDRSYYIAGSGDAAIIATDVETAGSQFFRRVVASLIEDDNAWDYRRYPHSKNIEGTIEMFSYLEDLKQRGC